MAAGLEEDHQDDGLTTSLNSLFMLLLNFCSSEQLHQMENDCQSSATCGLYGPLGT